MENVTKYRVLIYNIPIEYKTHDIKNFLKPIKCKALSFLKRGVAVAYFRSTKDITAVKESVNNNKTCPFKCKDYNEDIFVENPKEPKTKTNEFPRKTPEEIESEILNSGQLFIRNLSFEITEKDLSDLFSTYGTITLLDLPYDHSKKKIKGFAHIVYMFPKEAVKAYKALDKTDFKGKLLHILPGIEERLRNKDFAGKEDNYLSKYLKKKNQDLKLSSSINFNWNAFFISPNIVVDYLCERFQISKEDVNSPKCPDTLVRLTQAESQLVNELKKFLRESKVNVDLLDEADKQAASLLDGKRKREIKDSSLVSRQICSNTIIVKNLPYNCKLQALLSFITKKAASLKIKIEEPTKNIICPFGLLAFLRYSNSQIAKNVYNCLAYEKYEEMILLLQWAPVGIFMDDVIDVDQKKIDSDKKPIKTDPNEPPSKKKLKNEKTNSSGADETPNAVKKHAIEKTEGTEETKKNNKKLSRKQRELNRQNMRKNNVKAENLENKPEISQNNNSPIKENPKKKIERNSVIIIRNLSFQATEDEIYKIIKPIGGLIKVRLPRKPDGQIKGFGFAEFDSEDNAEKAIKSLSNTTHFLGRRMQLEYAIKR